MKNKRDTRPYHFLIYTDLHENLKEIADGRSVTYMINTAIKEYLSKFKDSSSDK